jgi:hypothetical protein
MHVMQTHMTLLVTALRCVRKPPIPATTFTTACRVCIACAQESEAMKEGKRMLLCARTCRDCANRCREMSKLPI